MIESSFIRWILRNINTARNITEKNNLQNITNFFYEKGWSMGLTITLHVNCIEKPTCPSNQMPYNLHNKTTKQFLHCALSI